MDMVIRNLFRFCIVLGCILLSACLGSYSPDLGTHTTPPQSTPAPWEPTAGDNNLVRGEVFLDRTDIVILESDIPKFVLRISGALPTPCHNIRVVVSEADDRNNIQVDVYSLAAPDEICIQVLEPFETMVPLGVYTSGEFQVVVNGKEIGEITP
ncbi:MAG: hypothetical protein ABUK20_00635 [Anaerolineales bacterium]